LLISLFFIWAVLLTGERSNSIKAIFGLFIFYFINDQFRIKEKLISILLVFILIGSLINSSDYIKTRYKSELIDSIVYVYQSKKSDLSTRKFRKSFEPSFLIKYYELYKSGFAVFKDHPYFGAGNKNYRHVTCAEVRNLNYICTTHPHQIYFEFLAEHGFIGTAIILFILFSLIFSKLKIILQSKNYIQIGCFIFLLILFTPILPSGAFFADYNFTIFWLNLSLMYAINNKTNVFSKN